MTVSGRWARATAVVCAALLTATCAWLITQDVIFGDEGFFLVAYSQFLQAPERVARATSAFWLTDVIGAVWLHVIPVPGILALRLGAAIFYLGSAAVAWAMLGRIIGPIARWSVGLTVGVALASGYVYLEYTVLTAFVLTAASGLLLSGARSDAFWRLAAAGALLGIGVFLRLPNLLLPTLALAPIVFSLIERTAPRRGAHQSTIILAGVSAGVLAACLLMAALHDSAYVEQAVADFLWQPQSVHSSARLLHDAARTAVLGGAQGAACWFVLAGAAIFASRHRRMAGAIGVIVIAGLVAVHALVPRVDWSYTVLGLVSFGLLLAIARPTAGVELRRVAVLALWGLVLLGAGSASLPWPLLLGLSLGLPVAFHTFTEVRVGVHLGLSRPAARLHGRLLAYALAALAVSHVVPVTPYLQAFAGRRPPVLPHELTARPTDARLWPLHTSAPLAQATDELLRALPQFVQPGDAMLVSNGIPLIVFLASAKPFLGHPYPDLVGVSALRTDLSSADWSHPWPVWVHAKYMPAADFAVTRTTGSDFGDTRETREWLAAFLRARGYEAAWDNALFEISTPPPSHFRAR
jgi:hypothetical protein